MSEVLRIDLETRCDIDLLKHGVYVYAMHPSADVLMASYKIGSGPLQRWRRGQPCPSDIAAHIASGGEVRAFNSAFERLMWWHVLTPKYGWPKPRLEQFRCTAVTAAAMSLPRSLEMLGRALDLSVQKDKRGKALMKIHSIPQGFTADGKAIWHPLADDEKSLDAYHEYCDFDVLTEEAAEKRLVPLSAAEMECYWLNERINDRGLRIDTVSARAAVEMAEKAKEKINAELREVTGWRVEAVTQTARLLAWVREQGVELESLDKDTLDEVLHECDDLPERVRRALELRQEGAKPSVEKIAAMLDRCCPDGRARGVYLHHGAGQTGRFSSRGVQAHNMPKYRKVFEEAQEIVVNGKRKFTSPRLSTLFQVIRSADPEAVEWLYGPDLGRPLHLLSDAVRSFIWAAPGHDLIDVDYTSIEGVLAAWFAREDWKLDAFRALIAGTGPGMYELFAARGIYNVPVESITKPQRAVGKVGELSMGYQGGVGALARMARANKLKLASVYESVWASADEDRRDEAESRYEEQLKKHNVNAEKLGRQGYVAAELIKLGWRAAHPAISGAWKLLEQAAVAAVQEPGSTQMALGVQYKVARGFLWARLPSGRCLAYGAPRMVETEAPWADKTLSPEKREQKMSLTVLGTDAQTERWVRFPVYGGSLFNNVVQGSARDILVHGMKSAEAAGYPIVLHTHDEMAAEVPRGFGDVKELEQVASRLPAWCSDLPLKASGWRGKRYRKD
jgi:DNA polymerase